jgi:hypothetical protein
VGNTERLPTQHTKSDFTLVTSQVIALILFKSAQFCIVSHRFQYSVTVSAEVASCCQLSAPHIQIEIFIAMSLLLVAL